MSDSNENRNRIQGPLVVGVTFLVFLLVGGAIYFAVNQPVD